MDDSVNMRYHTNICATSRYRFLLNADYCHDHVIHFETLDDAHYFRLFLFVSFRNVVLCASGDGMIWFGIRSVYVAL